MTTGQSSFGTNDFPKGTPSWVASLRKITDYLGNDFLGGPRVLKLAWVINLHKAGTGPAMLFLMFYYQNFSIGPWLYLALHGSYGIAWLIKDFSFPDPRWQLRITFGGAFNIFVFHLTPYWLFGWLLISQPVEPMYPLPTPAWYALCVSLCFLGGVVMCVSDAQKYFTLKIRRGLITDGMQKYVRHPNYIGEMVLYAGLAMLSWHWFPAVDLLLVWVTVFLPNMVIKEMSLSRYPEWAEYKKRTWWLIPFIF